MYSQLMRRIQASMNVGKVSSKQASERQKVAQSMWCETLTGKYNSAQYDTLLVDKKYLKCAWWDEKNISDHTSCASSSLLSCQLRQY